MPSCQPATLPVPPQPLGCTCFRVRRGSRAVSRLYDQHLARAGLRTTQYSLLKRVAAGPLPISALAAKLAMERTTLSRNLKPLEQAGWVLLAPGDDPRQRIVSITQAGRAAIAQAAQSWQAAQAQLEGALGVGEVAELHRRIDAALARLTPLIEEN